MLAGLLNLSDITALTRIEFGLQGQMRHADDCIHRCSDLVAHVGQEIGLRLRARFRYLLGLKDRRLCPFTFCDVLNIGYDNLLAQVICTVQSNLSIEYASIFGAMFCLSVRTGLSRRSSITSFNLSASNSVTSLMGVASNSSLV